jgi:hypothetical protein
MRAAGLVVSIVICLAASAAGQTSLLFGVWTLSLSKSNLGGPPPREPGVTFEPSGADGVFAIEDTVHADGTRTTIRYTAKVDGRTLTMTTTDKRVLVYEKQGP